MSISGKAFYNKVCSLRSELSGVVTPEILDKICNEPSVQPFLQWFCENVNYVNVLQNEDIQIKNMLQETNEWLEGIELNNALEEATKDCPHLLQISSFDDTDINDLFAEFEIIKESYKEDENYVYTLQNGIRNLKKLEIKLEESIESEKEFLDKENIEAIKEYEQCYNLLKDFDTHNREFFKEVEYLLNTYANAAENKGLPVLWTQMPLELFIKQIELYNHYLDVHIKRHFESAQKDEQKTDSNYVSLMTNSKEKRIDNEKLQELTLCKTNLTNAKMEEVLAKAQEESCYSMFNYVQDIYNFGVIKIPRHSKLRTEISELTKRRDFLEENFSLLQEHQLTEVIHQFAEMEITKILKQDANAWLDRAKCHLEKLKSLRFLTRETGHVRTDMLRMFMEMQLHRLKDVSEFVADARHYLTTEYALSSSRCDTMQQQQEEYSATVTCSPNVHNSFHKLFISMVCGDDNMQTLNFALNKYNDLIDENKFKKQYMLETYFNSRANKLKSLEDEVDSVYQDEIRKDPTHMLKPVSYATETCYNEALESFQKVQNDLTKIRCQMKERLKADATLEREKNMLWQRFLIDSETLLKTDKDVKQMANKSCFGNTNSND